MAIYTVTLYAGSDIVTDDTVEGLKAARERARYFLSAEFAHECSMIYHALVTTKVEIVDDAGECVWDKFIA